MHRALIPIQPADHHLLAYYCRLQIALQTLSLTTHAVVHLPLHCLTPRRRPSARCSAACIFLLGTLVPPNNRLQTRSNLQDTTSPHTSG
jgi:hypothetical protein